MPPPAHFQQLARQGFGFAVYPEARIFDQPGGRSVQHLLFGDYITPPKAPDGRYKRWSQQLLQQVGAAWWLQVRSRQEEGWLRLDDLQPERVLEVNFVDIGQGDGCHLVTPSDEHFIIDAGEGDNMYRFLRWRFNLNNPGRPLPRFYALISHPDEDHWKGFEPLLSKLPAAGKRHIQFAKLYHNGILQRAGSSLGATVEVDGQRYLSDFMETREGVLAVLRQEGKKSRYETFLLGALKNYPRLEIETVWRHPATDNKLYDDGRLSLEVLAPVPERVNNHRSLRWFDPSPDQIGKTKNGHSVVLMAHIGKMKVLLGGDLNTRSVDYLMETYGGTDIRQLRRQLATAGAAEAPPLQAQMEALINRCRSTFQADVAKSCHHGSHDITNEFLQAVNPIVTVISSGDEESHSHPRPETLGAVGKYSRGERPLIYSTELARSSPEYVVLRAKNAATDTIKQRIVSTYGMITLRTDGERAIMAQKLEKARSQFGLLVKWQIDKLLWNDKRGTFITT